LGSKKRAIKQLRLYQLGNIFGNRLKLKAAIPEAFIDKKIIVTLSR